MINKVFHFFPKIFFIRTCFLLCISSLPHAVRFVLPSSIHLVSAATIATSDRISSDHRTVSEPPDSWWLAVINQQNPTGRLPLSFSLKSHQRLPSLWLCTVARVRRPRCHSRSPLCRLGRRSFRVFTLLPLPSFPSISRQIGLLRSSSSLWTPGSPDLVPSLIPAVLEV